VDVTPYSLNEYMALYFTTVLFMTDTIIVICVKSLFSALRILAHIFSNLSLLICLAESRLGKRSFLVHIFEHRVEDTGSCTTHS
jgi:hypothetical protein